MSNGEDKRPELAVIRVSDGWAVQAMAHNHDSAWIETKPMTYALALATMLGMAAGGEYALLEPAR